MGLKEEPAITFINFTILRWVPESSPQVKEERIENDMDEKPSSPEATTSTSSHGEKANSEPDESLLHAISAIGNAVYNRKPKPSTQASTDCNAGKLQPEPTSASLRRKRKPKVAR